MDKKSGRIVVTASGVHDPESPGGAQGSKASLGDLSGLVEQGPFFEMVDGSKFDADKAYKDSKVSR
jgi:protochlorophyllide reductase